MNRNVPKAVLFDVDGTLIDTVDLHAASWRQILWRYGRETSHDDVRRQIGKGGDLLMPVFLQEEMVERQGKEIEGARADLFLKEYFPRARPFPDVRPLFERIQRAGQRLVLASSGKADEVERYSKLAGIEDLVEAATSADDAEKSKPNPDIFVAALERIAPIGPDQAIVVGDTPYDVEAARRAGLRTIGVLSGGYARAELEKAGCVAIYWDCADLLRNYDTSPLAGG